MLGRPNQLRRPQLRCIISTIAFFIFLAAPAVSYGQTEDLNWKLCEGSDPDRSIPACSSLIQAGQQPDKLSEAYYSRGLAYGSKGDFDHSILDHSEAIRLNPELAEAYYRRGNALTHKPDYDRALQDYDQAIRLQSGNAEFFYARGIANTHKRNYDGAYLDYDQAILLKPGFGNAFYGRGIVHARRAEYEMAIQDYTQAIRLNAVLPSALYARSLAYAHQASYGAAMADYGRYLWARIGAIGIAFRGILFLLAVASLTYVWSKSRRPSENGKRPETVPESPEDEAPNFESIDPQSSHPQLVAVKEFGNRLEAELARGILESAKIGAMIQADTAGAMRDHLAWGDLGFRILVRETDASTAREMLTPPASEPDFSGSN